MKPAIPPPAQRGNLDLDAALARKLHTSLKFDGDDEATKRLLYLALEAGMRACNRDTAFKAEVQSVKLLHVLQQIPKTEQTLERVVAHTRLRDDIFVALISLAARS